LKLIYDIYVIARMMPVSGSDEKKMGKKSRLFVEEGFQENE
jgi:hypothetical protein